MPDVTILQKSKTESVHFQETFLVQEDALGKMFWAADKQTNGIIKLWVQRWETGLRLAFVLPDWQLTIDDVRLEKKLYEKIELEGRKVSVSYKDYTFLFNQ